MKKIYYIIFIQFIFILLVGCSRNESNSDSSRPKTENTKQKYFGTYNGWNGKDSSKLVLFNKAYLTHFKDTIKVNYDYEIDNSVLRLYNPRYQMNYNAAKLLELYHAISIDYKDIVIFYDIIDSTSFRGVNIVYTKQK